MTTQPVPRPRIRVVAGVDLLGWSEVEAAVFLVVGIVGSLFGHWMAVQLRAVLG